tara:strand:- start:1016 stop:1636 length:621 start_codon:yes stop_codon:yes gene_type:complete
MPIAINGSGTVTGISVGGLPDGIVDTDMIAAAAVTGVKRNAGSILQMQSTLKTDYSSMTNTSFTDISGLSVSITPQFSNSKIIVTLTCSIGHRNNEYGTIKIVQNSSGSFADIDVGDGFNANDGNTMTPGNITTDDPTDDYGQYKVFTGSCTIVHSPGTTNAVTYKAQYKTNYSSSQGIYINRSYEIGNTIRSQGTSSITVMEVKV